MSISDELASDLEEITAPIHYEVRDHYNPLLFCEACGAAVCDTDKHTCFHRKLTELLLRLVR